VVAAGFEELEPGPDVEPAVIDRLVGCAESFADRAYGRAEHRVVAARIDAED
jgi:hypothetical protein